MLQPITIGIYSFIILVGGMIGYYTQHSQASLIMSLVFSILLAVCAIGMLKNIPFAYIASKILTGALLAFFLYRFYLKLKFMPAGLVALLSLITLIILFLPVRGSSKRTT